MGSHEVQRCESPIEVTPHLDQRQDTRGGLVNADQKPLAIDICGGEKYLEQIKPLNWVVLLGAGAPKDSTSKVSETMLANI